MLKNYHTHTFRCRHAKGTEREYVEAAIAAGYTTLGFSDHCPWRFPKEYRSGIRMDCEELPDYVATLQALREEFRAKIKIFIGLECEYVPEEDAWQREFYADKGLDYLIMGQHFVGHEIGGFYCGGENKDPALLAKQVDLMIEGLESGRYLYLAHPDLPNFKGEEEDYLREMSRLCEYLKKKELPVEINRLGVATDRHYPNEKFLMLASDHGLKAIIGIDAHDPAQLLDLDSRVACEALACRFGLPFDLAFGL